MEKSYIYALEETHKQGINATIQDKKSTELTFASQEFGIGNPAGIHYD